MRKIKKYLRFQNIELIASQAHPKDLSRARFKIIDQSIQAQPQYKTQSYGLVQDNKIQWSSMIQLPYTSQDHLKYQTICQHEYGYQIDQLKALYQGIIYLKPDQFFFQNTAHCLNQQGQQCGYVKFIIKVIQKQQKQQGQKIIQVVLQQKQPVSVDLIAKVSLYSAQLNIIPIHQFNFFKKQKKNLCLKVKIGKQQQNGKQKTQKQSYRWNINWKLQLTNISPKLIQVFIDENNVNILKGGIYFETIEQNKRFTVQTIPLYDLLNQKIGYLQLDLRYVTKKQILDLMYSPTQLSDVKNQQKSTQKYNKSRYLIPSISDANIYMNKNKIQTARQQQVSLSRISPQQRYKIKVIGQHNQISIPRAHRFSSQKNPNHNISYITQDFMSDFSPKKFKGASISNSKKTDFTRNYRNNPGVGEYMLPSIWKK